jgi:hypothetical protein
MELLASYINVIDKAIIQISGLGLKTRRPNMRAKKREGPPPLF